MQTYRDLQNICNRHLRSSDHSLYGIWSSRPHSQLRARLLKRFLQNPVPWTDRQTDRQTDRHVDRDITYILWTERNRQTHTHTHTHTQRITGLTYCWRMSWSLTMFSAWSSRGRSMADPLYTNTPYKKSQYLITAASFFTHFIGPTLLPFLTTATGPLLLDFNLKHYQIMSIVKCTPKSKTPRL